MRTKAIISFVPRLSPQKQHTRTIILMNQPVVADIEEILYNPGTSRTDKSVRFTE